MRQIARNIARETMKRAGFTRFNKKRAVYGGRSLFSLHWRDALAQALRKPDQVYGGV